MIKKFEVQGVHMVVDDNTYKYVVKKIGHLDKYIPRSAEESTHAEVTLKESKAKNNNHCTCEVTLYLPKETINVTETTINTFAAIDIVETKLKQRILKYKDLHHNAKLRRRLAAKFRRQAPKTS
jgi:ribosomal subunit interface protein